jgi:hypothetical protein
MGDGRTRVLVLAVLVCSLGCELPDSHPAPRTAPPVPYGAPVYYWQPYGFGTPPVAETHPPASYGAGTAITATAPIGMSVAMLGAPLDEHFHALRGLGASLPVFSGGAYPPTPVRQFESDYYKAEKQLELGANISGWFAGGGASGDSNTRYVSARARYVEYAVELNERSTPNPAPDGAVWYIGKIYFGSTYEMVLFEHDTSMNIHAAADFFAWRGDMHAYASAHHLNERIIAHGLVPKNGSAIFSHTPAEVAQNFQLTQDSLVPVMVEYRSMPNANPADAPIPWKP